jgi:hypothetical protein
MRAAKIVVVAQQDDETLEELKHLPAGAEVLFTGAKAEDFTSSDAEAALANATVLLNCIGTRAVLSELWPKLPKLEWIHSRFAGGEHTFEMPLSVLLGANSRLSRGAHLIDMQLNASWFNHNMI